MNRTILFLLLLTLASGLWLGYEHLRLQPSTKQEQLKPRFGGVYVRAISDLPVTLDPAFVTDATACEVVVQLYSRLLRVNAGMELVNDLIKELSISPDEKTYTLRLREKVRFHTVIGNGVLSQNKGRELIAQDVKYTMERLLNPKVNSPHRDLLLVVDGAERFANGETTAVSGIQVTGRHSLTITLRNPFSPFLAILTTPALSIVPWEDVEFHQTNFSLHPAGSGPFILESRDKEKGIVLRSNLDFYRGRPYLDKVEFRIIPTDLKQFEEFYAGRIHHVNDMPAHRLKDAVKEKRFKFKETSSLITSYLGMQTTLAPFDNKDVRKAFNYAINKRLLVKYIKNNHGVVAKGPLPPEVLGYSHGVEPYPFDLDKAREHLRRAGYSIDSRGLVQNFPDITMQTILSEDTRAAAAAIQANLADLGIRVSLKYLSVKDHWLSIDSGTVPLFSLAWIADYPDADNVLYYNFHSRNIPASNSSWYQNPEVDNLLEKARQTADTDSRLKLYQQAEGIIVDDAPWVFLYYPTTHFLLQKWVHGLEICAFGGSEVDYYHVWLSEERT